MRIASWEESIPAGRYANWQHDIHLWLASNRFAGRRLAVSWESKNILGANSCILCQRWLLFYFVGVKHFPCTDEHIFWNNHPPSPHSRVVINGCSITESLTDSTYLCMVEIIDLHCTMPAYQMIYICWWTVENVGTLKMTRTDHATIYQSILHHVTYCITWGGDLFLLSSDKQLFLHNTWWLDYSPSTLFPQGDW